MKNITVTVFCALSIFLFAGCNVTEDILIDNGGKGLYTQELDLSSAIGFMSMFGGMDSLKGYDFNKLEKDTTVNLKDFTDTASGLSEEERRLFKRATIHLTSNMEENVLKLKFNFPYERESDLQQLLSMNTQKNGLSYLMKSSGMENKMMNSDNGDMPDFSSLFTFTSTKGSLERTINKATYDSLKQRDEFAQIEQAQAFMSAFTYQTTIHLPRPAKKVSGEKAVLSADKKTVTISGSITDLLSNPAEFSYKVEY